MIDRDLLDKQLAFVESMAAELRKAVFAEALALQALGPAFVRRGLAMPVRAACDAAAHIVEAEGLGDPDAPEAVFDHLHAGGWIDAQVRDGMRAVLRLAAEEGAADPRELAPRAADRLDDLVRFAAAIRARLGDPDLEAG